MGEEGCVRLGMQKSEIRFNPCCNGSGWRSEKAIIKEDATNLVSILVVMEVGEEVSANVLGILKRDCFNPCCNGSGWRRIELLFNRGYIVKFQSLL